MTNFDNEKTNNSPVPSLLNLKKKYEIVGEISCVKKLGRRRVTVKQKINEGINSTIYLVTLKDAQNGSADLICKVIDKNQAQPLFVSKFLPREMKIASRISYPHCIQIHTLIETNRKCYMFMRFAENGDLYDYISKHGPMAESHSRLWFRQVALAVKYFHSMHLGHRDIKCENILITKKMNAKLSDFGFCRSCISKDGIEKLSDTYCGSLLYASPEVLRGKPYKIRPADVWSLGVVLFVMVNGSHPFTGKRVKDIRQQQIEKNYHWEPRVKASSTLKKLIDSMFDPDVRTRVTIDGVLNSPWMKKDPRVIELVPDV